MTLHAALARIGAAALRGGDPDRAFSVGGVVLLLASAVAALFISVGRATSAARKPAIHEVVELDLLVGVKMTSPTPLGAVQLLPQPPDRDQT